jgi:hypothetical protein
MDAVSTSETLVYFNDTTQRYIPEGCYLHTNHRENLKAQQLDGVRSDECAGHKQ